MKRLKSAPALLFLSLFVASWTFSRQHFAPHVEHENQSLNMSLIASVKLPSTTEAMSLTPGFGENELYLTDLVSGRVQKINWKTGEQGARSTLDTAGCSSFEPHVSSVATIKRAQQLLVQNCGRIQLLDKDSLIPIREIIDSKQRSLHGFNLSPSEQFLLVGATMGRKQSILAYRTADWTLAREWDFENGSISADDRTYVMTFTRRTNPASFAADECGFRLYDVNSGQKTAEFVRSSKENDDVCPDYPGPFVPGQPRHMITTDSLRGGISEWDLSNGRLIQHLVSKRSAGPPPGVESLSISHDGRLLAVVTARRELGVEWGLTIWDLSSGRTVYETPLGRQSDPVMRAYFCGNANELILIHPSRLEVFEYQLAK
jgi:hypothetical protein